MLVKKKVKPSSFVVETTPRRIAKVYDGQGELELRIIHGDRPDNGIVVKARCGQEYSFSAKTFKSVAAACAEILKGM